MNTLTESILNDAKKVGEDIRNARDEATNTTSGANTSASGVTTRSSNAYICDVGTVSVLAIGVCVFFAHSKKPS